jgi:hypothetical protein
MLKETGSVSKKEANEMRNSERALQNIIDKLKGDAKGLNNKIKQKEMETAMATKKVQELTDSFNESKIYFMPIGFV